MCDELFIESEYQEEISGESTCLELVAEKDDAGKRIDAYIAEKTDLTRSAASRLIESGDAIIIGTEGKKRLRIIR